MSTNAETHDTQPTSPLWRFIWIGSALCALLIGTVVAVWYQRAADQADAIARLKAVGCGINYEPMFPWLPLETRRSDSFVTHLFARPTYIAVSLDDDADVTAELERLPSVKRVVFQGLQDSNWENLAAIQRRFPHIKTDLCTKLFGWPWDD